MTGSYKIRQGMCPDINGFKETITFQNQFQTHKPPFCLESSLETSPSVILIMKKNYVLPIMFCMVSFFAISACEKAEIQQVAKSNKHIEGRSCVDDCSDCAVNDCCCSITILDDPGFGVNIGLCGTSSPCLSTTACDAESVGSCADIDGFEEPFMFTSQFQSIMFCVPQGSSFGITNPGTGTQRFRLTCQVGQFNPQTVTIQLNTPPDKPYWETNGSCELIPCF